jgi:hypothetical protein
MSSSSLLGGRYSPLWRNADGISIMAFMAVMFNKPMAEEVVRIFLCSSRVAHVRHGVP